jgi:hypothetical protein
MVKSQQEAKSARTRAARNATRRAFAKLPVNQQLAEKRELLEKMYARYLKRPHGASRMERIQKGEADPTVEELEGLMMGVQLKHKRADPEGWGGNAEGGARRRGTRRRQRKSRA